MSIKQKQLKKFSSNILITTLSIFTIILVLMLYFLTNYRQEKKISDEACINNELGISLKLPDKKWTCHNNNGYFYVEPPWVEIKPNTGSSPQFTISFSKIKDRSVGVNDDWRFCSPKEYSLTNNKCLISSFYSHNDFKILKYVDQKVVGIGGTTNYIGFFDNFLEVQFNPSFNEYKLGKEDISNFDKLFDSIKKI